MRSGPGRSRVLIGLHTGVSRSLTVTRRPTWLRCASIGRSSECYRLVPLVMTSDAKSSLTNSPQRWRVRTSPAARRRVADYPVENRAGRVCSWRADWFNLNTGNAGDRPEGRDALSDGSSIRTLEAASTLWTSSDGGGRGEKDILGPRPDLSARRKGTPTETQDDQFREPRSRQFAAVADGLPSRGLAK